MDRRALSDADCPFTFMSERITQAQRSRIMAAVRSRDTRPEMTVRRLVHALGYRFRLHRRDLPGTPDIVLPKLRKIINVNGCFWHMHTCRHGCLAPVKNAEFWNAKRTRTAARDRRTVRQLRSAGWMVLIIWECQMRDAQKLERRVATFLSQ